jgi:uncharacterized protein involved in tolerance to divalent cations
MSHYLVIRLETEQIAQNLAESLIKNYMWLNGYHLGNGEDIYYNANNICEDISEVTLILKTEDEE